MKKLQNNFTTPEQSKQLLELGVPADSADCAMFPYDETFEQYELRVVPFNKVFSTYEIYNEDGTIYPSKTPCWSVGRLMAIYFISKGLDLWSPQFKKYQIENSAEYFIAIIANNIKDLDFSKLEE